MDRDRLLRLVALGEVVALEHARDGVLRGEPDHVRGAHRAEPFGVETHLGAFAVEDLEDLVGVGLGVALDLLARERRARDVLPVGSPIIPVKSPIRKITWWPRSWNCRILLSSTVWPRCRSGAVGSKPALMRSGRPSLSARLELLALDDFVGAAADQVERGLQGRSLESLEPGPRAKAPEAVFRPSKRDGGVNY